VAGVIKMIGALRHGRLPASLHVGEPSRHVDWDSGAVRVLAEPAEWPAAGRPRRAGISSFGLSGTNAHVVLEQAPVPPEESRDAVEPGHPGSEPGPVPLVLSARTPSALAQLAGRLGERLAASNPTALPAVAASLARRTRFEHRAVLLADGPGAGGDGDGVRAPLESLAGGTHHPGLVTGTVRPGGTGLLLPGQGAQRPGMGRGLAAEFPVFAGAFDDACAALDPFLDRPLRDVCWGDDAQCLADTRWAQPALFALQVAGSRLLLAWGLEPSVVIGHSVGEIAAAHLCGALSLDDAARLAAVRGRLMAELPGGGSMAALSGPSAALTALAAELPAGVAVAARNSSTGLVLSGESAALEALLGDLDPAVRVSRLHTSHAFHSPLMAPAAQALAAAAGELGWAPPRLPAASTVSGAMVAEQTWRDPGHWSRQLTDTVLFADAVSAASAATGVGRWAEVGVHPALVGHVRADRDTVAVCLGHADEPAGLAARRAAARLWCAGAELPGWLPDTGPRGDPHADLPTYPFEHRRYWPTIRPANDLTRLRVAWTALDQVDRVPGGRWVLLTGSRGPADPATTSTAKALREILDARVVGTDVELCRALAGPDPVAGVVAVVGDAGEVPDLVRAVVAGGATATRLWCLTRGAVRWEAGEEAPGARPDGSRARAADVGPDPRAASVWGIGRSAALEHPTVWGGLVDLSDPADDPTAEAAAVAGVLAGDGEDQVAVRGGRAYGRRLAPAADPGEAWQPSGTVLVTGGTGALGSHVALWAAKHGAERIVLTGRRGPDAPGAAALRSEIEALGVPVELAAVDAADRDSVTALIAGLTVAGPPLTTVVHAAGVLDDAPVAKSGAALISATARPKAVGAAVLDAATRGRGVDLVVLTSVAGVWGSGGQGAYAAANAEADAVVVGRRAAGERAVALAWGPWDGAGMAADPQARAALGRRGLRPIDPDRALAVLPELVRGPDPVVVVADLDLDRFVATFTAARAAALLGDLAVPASTAADPADRASGVAPRWRTTWFEASPDHRRDVLAGLLRTEVGAVLGHPNPATIDVTTAFRDLGLDSVTSVELRDRARAGTGLDLPASLAFDHPSIEELATEIDAALAEEADAGTDTGDLVAALDRLAPRLSAARLDGRTEDVRNRLRALLDSLPTIAEPRGRGPEIPGPRSGAAGGNGAGSGHAGRNGVRPDGQGPFDREQLADADDDALFAFIDTEIGRR
jgi:acyl transferase domain-containing protein/acyl carrier protein